MGASFVADDGSSLSFDLVLTENPRFPNQIAEHVVEQGADVGDNIRVGLQQITLEVWSTNEPITENNQFGTGSVSNAGPINMPDADGQPPENPFGPIATVATWFTLPIGVPLVGSLVAQEIDEPTKFNAGLSPTKGGTINPRTLQFPDSYGDVVQQTHDQLKKYRDNGNLLTVLGTKGTYENMAIESFDMQRSQEHGTGAQFTIELKEIRQVSTSLVTAPKPSIPRGNAPVSKGSQATTETAQTTEQSALSVLQGLFSGQTVPPP